MRYKSIKNALKQFVVMAEKSFDIGVRVGKANISSEEIKELKESFIQTLREEVTEALKPLEDSNSIEGKLKKDS